MYYLIRKHSIIVSILFLFSAQISADIETGLKAVEAGDYMIAYQEFKTLAEQGDAEAQHSLAILLKTGKGVMKDTQKAAKWFRKAADQGLADSCFNLARLYDKGEGVEKDNTFAALWYRKAAEKGHALAQTNLGVMHANGDGVPQDLIQAYVWFNLAAAQGIGVALDNREALSEHLSDEMKEKARGVSREYFMRYVAPFNPPSASSLRVKSGHGQPPASEEQKPHAPQQQHPEATAPHSH